MRGPSRFADRRDAGRRLAERVRRSIAVDDLHDPLVLALPRGGVPVAVAVAAALGAELDVLVARKVGLPGRPEVGVGAVAEGGVRIADDDLLGRADSTARRSIVSPTSRWSSWIGASAPTGPGDRSPRPRVAT
ncbi:MAG: phosphoribosyltransferase family protein [Ilumatobacteraceae bacterium]